MGGMANVYKAFDVIDQRDVAVKILREEYADNTEFLRRFKNESKAIAVLSHPNIVRVYDVSFTNRVHSIVMEYIDGITLKDYIEHQSVLTWKEAIHFTLQILRALQHAHDKGIVHRDIKPQNIMLLQNGTIKVTDFGIARFARSEVKTITDRAIGSVHYIRPRAGNGRQHRRKVRHLLGRRHAVRDADRPPAVRGGHGGFRRAQTDSVAGRAPYVAQPGHSAD